MPIILKNTSLKNTNLSGYLSPLDLNPASSWNEEKAISENLEFIQTNDAGSLGLSELAVAPTDRRLVLRDSKSRQGSYYEGSGATARNVVYASGAYTFMHDGSDAAFIAIFYLKYTSS